MATKRLIYTRPDGGVDMVEPAPEIMARFASEAEALAAVAARSVPKGAPYVVVEATELPPDEDQEGWEIVGGRVRVKAGWKRPAPPKRSREEAVTAALLRKGAISEADIDAELASDRAP